MQKNLCKKKKMYTYEIDAVFEYERPFICDFNSCQQRFSLVRNLKNHQKTHDGVKRYDIF